MKKKIIILMSLLALVISVNSVAFAKSSSEYANNKVETSWKSTDGIKYTVISNHKITGQEKN